MRGGRGRCVERKKVKPFFHKDRVGKVHRGARKRATEHLVNERTKKLTTMKTKMWDG